MAVRDNTAVLTFNPRAQMLRDLGYPGDPSQAQKEPQLLEGASHWSSLRKRGRGAGGMHMTPGSSGEGRDSKDD